MNPELSITDLIGSSTVELHYKRPHIDSMTKISRSQDVSELLRQHINLNQIDYKEFFWVILLSNSNHVLGLSQISVGSTNATFVNLKEVYQLALLSSAVGVIISHNHPSGTLKPSDSDIKLTKKIKKGLDILDLKLLDHLILTSEDYYSFSDEGML